MMMTKHGLISRKGEDDKYVLRHKQAEELVSLDVNIYAIAQ